MTPRIAYFSMEVALEASMPTYAGGLGILAGDTLRSAADLGLPLVAVSLLHRKGYFFQQLTRTGRQTEAPVNWAVNDFAQEVPVGVTVLLEGHPVLLRAWKYDVQGASGQSVSVFLLDADREENRPEHRRLTDHLYGGDNRYRLCQEAILGLGGVRLLRALGYGSIERFHMNEGHSSLLAVELMLERLRADPEQALPELLKEVRKQCVFTTHTPVPAGHDQFQAALVHEVLGGECNSRLFEALGCERVLNMTALALTTSHYVNGVAKKHGEISRQLFPNYSVDSITNGVHAATWTAPPVERLFDQYIPGWRQDNYSLRAALSIPEGELRHAHREAKRRLIDVVSRECNSGMDLDFLTLGFARRATSYKRPDLVLSDLRRLERIASPQRPLQLVFAGKAHPEDEEGKRLIETICAARTAPHVKICYLANYDMALAKLLVAGVDVWLNTPHPPHEASGTSGMKAALNGVPSLSVLDGWWIEGCIEGVTGWGIGQAGDSEVDIARHAGLLYDKLENVIFPCYYERPSEFSGVMRHAIALNGSFFSTQRMLGQYVVKAYFS